MSSRGSSYEKIHYGQRPAKHVERLMLCESFRKLEAFGNLQSYRYVGFGSIYFTDFLLFHRSLGINNMVSIEHDEVAKSRFDFNRPFDCIEMKYGPSSQKLPELPWQTRTIAWLDYDERINPSVLADIQLVCTKAPIGSVIIVSVNAHYAVSPDPLEVLKEAVGDDHVPAEVKAEDLAGWSASLVLRDIITSEIETTLRARNGGLADGSKMKYRQLYFFQYQDGAKMLTVGGVLYDEGQEQHVGGFNSLSFVRSQRKPYKIQVPMLTYRELRHLDRKMPNAVAGADTHDIPPQDVANYAGLYRYFPTFAVTDL